MWAECNIKYALKGFCKKVLIKYMVIDELVYIE